MDKLWTWKGKFFGYKENNRLWTHSGENIGKFYGNEVYGVDGHYLGELINGLLITKKKKKNRRKAGFRPETGRTGIVKSINQVGRVMLAGYEDFPSPDSF